MAVTVADLQERVDRATTSGGKLHECNRTAVSPDNRDVDCAVIERIRKSISEEK